MVWKLFLPGAGGSASFWLPVVKRLPADWDCMRLSWPGLGEEPHEPAIRGVEDLVAMVLDRMHEPTDLVAQSMGGLIALKVALRAPHLVRRMVLTGTSGGIPVDTFGATDWREQYRHDYPDALPWITEIREDLSGQLNLIEAPALLIWGEADEVSPVPAALELQRRLPNSTLALVPNGEHDFPVRHPVETADLIRGHLSAA